MLGYMGKPTLKGFPVSRCNVWNVHQWKVQAIAETDFNHGTCRNKLIFIKTMQLQDGDLSILTMSKYTTQNRHNKHSMKIWKHHDYLNANVFFDKLPRRGLIEQVQCGCEQRLVEPVQRLVAQDIVQHSCQAAATTHHTRGAKSYKQKNNMRFTCISEKETMPWEFRLSYCSMQEIAAFC